MAKKKFTEKDLLRTCDLLWSQLQEDRQIFTTQYSELKGMLSRKYGTLCCLWRSISKIC